MSDNFKIESPYLPGEKGCRITWLYTDDDEKTLYLRHEDLMEIIDILEHGSTAKVEMEDGASSILVNSDSTDFFLFGIDLVEIPLMINVTMLIYSRIRKSRNSKIA